MTSPTYDRLGCPLDTEMGGLLKTPPGGFGMACWACFEPVRLVFGLFRADFNDFEPQINKNPSNFNPLWRFFGPLAFGVAWSAWGIAKEHPDCGAEEKDDSQEGEQQAEAGTSASARAPTERKPRIWPR